MARGYCGSKYHLNKNILIFLFRGGGFDIWSARPRKHEREKSEYYGLGKIGTELYSEPRF